MPRGLRKPCGARDAATPAYSTPPSAPASAPASPSTAESGTGEPGQLPRAVTSALIFEAPNAAAERRGCIEALASGPAIAERARARIGAQPLPPSKLLELAGGDPAGITGEVVGQAWRTGDEAATEVLRETAELLAIWLGNVVDLLEPNVMVIGGGVGELVAAWFPLVRKLLPSWSINQRCHENPPRTGALQSRCGHSRSSGAVPGRRRHNRKLRRCNGEGGFEPPIQVLARITVWQLSSPTRCQAIPITYTRTHARKITPWDLSRQLWDSATDICRKQGESPRQLGENPPTLCPLTA
jgi:ROK family protein